MSTPPGAGTRAPAKKDNAFTRKIGPLPMWGWLLIALAFIGVYVIYDYRKQKQSAASTSSTGTTTGATTGAGQVPQFVNQVYNYEQPPTAPTPPPSTVKPGGKGKPPAPASAPVTTQMTLTQAIAAAAAAGYTISGLSLQGVAGKRNAMPISPSQYAAYGSYPISGVTTNGKQLTLQVNGPSL